MGFLDTIGSVGSAVGNFFSAQKPATNAGTAKTISTGTGKLPPLPADHMTPAKTGSSKIALDDQGDLDITDASKRLKTAFGVDDAWGKVLYLRDHNAGDPGFKANDKEVRDKLGLSRPLTKIELRDMEHYLYASLATQEGFAADQVKKGDGTLTRAGKIIDRGVKGAGMATATLGYSAAKWIGQNTPVDPLKALGGDSNTPGTTKASWQEVGAGLKGIRDGMADPEAR